MARNFVSEILPDPYPHYEACLGLKQVQAPAGTQAPALDEPGLRRPGARLVAVSHRMCAAVRQSHVVAEFQQSVSEGATRRKALSHTLGLVTRPIVLTTITTAAGFLAFLATDLVPLRELGVQAAIGVWVALLLTYLFAVPVLSFGRARPATATGFASTRDIFDRLLGGITSFVVRVPWLIAIVFMVNTDTSLSHLSEAIAEIGENDNEAYFDFGLRALLNGIDVK